MAARIQRFHQNDKPIRFGGKIYIIRYALATLRTIQ